MKGNRGVIFIVSRETKVYLFHWDFQEVFSPVGG